MRGERVLELSRQMLDGHIKYVFGAKAATSQNPTEISAVDCSGFVRYFIYHATDGFELMPDGSDNQLKWCKGEGFEKIDYSDAEKYDGWLRIAFMKGHVWLVHCGRTLESHQSRKHIGPDRRHWNDSSLMGNVTACYKLSASGILHDLSPRNGIQATQLA